ncbi:hypothetical protein [Thermoplasma volcanium GSS1]|uniref:Methyltransferase domain-containing protein n=1 Tax=Thermoplasma volcanium (strain ATCC 51530 / DSM 4299 / JCM 9571 / NBRC 15438 / GSS1) TaxID=273116 RepID=Q97A94_THEVO|nr:methyltransferase domain-containing protein [Thermoplasma volcanium]BAB60058.1 hypothetical protein [Thermoplasma volcanium GSS1]
MSDNPFFKKFAEDYAKSKSHEKGQDLTELLGLINTHRDTCLDVATGTGFTAASISQICAHVTALDETRAMIEQAQSLIESRATKNVKFVLSTFEDFDDGKFDLITCRRALHHFKDKEAFFKKARTMLNPGGILAIADMVSPANDRKDNFNVLERIRDPTHIGALKVEEMIKLFEENNFQDIKYKIITEELTFEEWLYPITKESEVGKKCLEFLNSLSTEELNQIRLDANRLTLSKQRIVIAASVQ